MLTQARKYGMIAVAWTMYDCCGDADAEAEAPPSAYFFAKPRLVSLVR